MVQRGEGAGRGRVGLAAVGGQRPGDVAGPRVEGGRGHRGGVEGPVQRLQERHGLVARGDVLRRLRERGVVGEYFTHIWSFYLRQTLAPPHRVLLGVGRLRRDDRVKAGGRQRTELLPHGSDLQQGSER